MPPHAIPRCAQDFIFYYYAKLVIAPSAGFDGNYRFVIDAYQRLKIGKLHISDYDRELLRVAQQSHVCAYCGSADSNSAPSMIIPNSLGGPIGIHNLVTVCQPCQASKGDRDLVDWWRNVLGRSHDTIPRVPIGLYLKLAYEARRANLSLGQPCTDLAQVFQPMRQHL